MKTKLIENINLKTNHTYIYSSKLCTHTHTHKSSTPKPRHKIVLSHYVTGISLLIPSQKSTVMYLIRALKNENAMTCRTNFFKPMQIKLSSHDDVNMLHGMLLLHEWALMATTAHTVRLFGNNWPNKSIKLNRLVMSSLDDKHHESELHTRSACERKY